MKRTDNAVNTAVQNATVVKKPNEFWTRTKEECIFENAPEWLSKMTGIYASSTLSWRVSLLSWRVSLTIYIEDKAT